MITRGHNRELRRLKHRRQLTGQQEESVGFERMRRRRPRTHRVQGQVHNGGDRKSMRSSDDTSCFIGKYNIHSFYRTKDKTSNI